LLCSLRVKAAYYTVILWFRRNLSINLLKTSNMGASFSLLKDLMCRVRYCNCERNILMTVSADEVLFLLNNGFSMPADLGLWSVSSALPWWVGEHGG
jgi:hypothetical protein